MNRNEIFSDFNIAFSERKGAFSYSADRMLRLFLRALKENRPLVLPTDCDEKELDSFARFLSDNKEAFRNTKKGLPYEFYRGESLFSEDEKSLYLFIFTDDKAPVLLKGMLKSKKEITYLSSGRTVEIDEIEEPWNGANTIWLQLDRAEIKPLCTVIRITSPEPVKIFYGTGIHIKT